MNFPNRGSAEEVPKMPSLINSEVRMDHNIFKPSLILLAYSAYFRFYLDTKFLLWVTLVCIHDALQAFTIKG